MEGEKNNIGDKNSCFNTLPSQRNAKHINKKVKAQKRAYVK